MNDPINTQDDETRALLGGPMKIELRGYEVAKETPEGWEQVNRFPPNDSGLARARREALWLTERAVDRKTMTVYAVRPIVSLDPWALGNQPMVLEEDPPTPPEDAMSWDKAKDMVVAMRTAEARPADHERPIILGADGNPIRDIEFESSLYMGRPPHE